MLEGVRAGKRSFTQKFFSDPIIGIVAIFLYYTFGLMPVDMASWLGEKIGILLSLVMKKKNKIALYNLQKCFPEKSDEERKEIMHKMWKNLGRILGEMPHMKKLGRNKKVELCGQEYIDQMKNDNKGGFIVSAHLGNWELCSAVITQMGIPVHIVYRMANNPWVEKAILQRRKEKGCELIPKGMAGARRMIELLKEGGHFGILCDQKLREGIDVPFFGYPAKTAPAVASLSLKFDAPMFPVRVERIKGTHYRCTFHKPIEIERTGNTQQDIYLVMCKVNQMLEDWIRERPEQWLWIHHRWDKSEYPK